MKVIRLWSVALCVAALSSPLIASQVAADSTGVLVREALIEEVLQNNPGIAEAGAAIRAARARLDLAGSLEDPRLSASVAPLTLDDSSIGAAVSGQSGDSLEGEARRP